MAQKIKPENISTTAEKIIKKHARKKKGNKYCLLKDGINTVAGNFFWLPVYKMFIQSGLIDPMLTANDFMINKGFAVSWNELKGEPVGIGGERFCLTPMGLDFLSALISEVHWDNLWLAPPGTWSIKITDGINRNQASL